MRLYHFLPAEHALDDLKNRRLKVARLSNLNDPFDCFVHIMTPERADYRFLKDEWNERYGMLCFSASYNDPVQWSHYADKHHGVAFGFDVDDGLAEEVEYVEDPPTVYFTDAEGTDEEWGQVSGAMFYKYIHWQYENEYRAFFELNEVERVGDLYFKKFDDRLVLREIILGFKCGLHEQTLLSTAKGLSGVRVLKCSISEDAYYVQKAIFIENL